MERPWGILSLFTTCFRLRVNSWAWLRPFPDYECIGLASGCDTDMYAAALWNRSFFLRWITADPSPRGNFTPPTKHVYGETLGDLEPVYDLFPITSEFALSEAVTQTCVRHLRGAKPVEKVVIFTVNHRGTPTSREPNRWNMILETPWWGGVGGILSLFKTRFRSSKAGTKTCGLLVWIFIWQVVRTEACGRIMKHHGRGYNVTQFTMTAQL